MTLPYWIAPEKREQLMPPPATRAPVELGAAEVLTGFVQGKKASDLEERAANSHYKLGIPFSFRVRISVFPVPKPETTAEVDTPRYWYQRWEIDHAEPVRQLIPVNMSMNLPGELEIDFLVDWRGVMWPIMIDGQIGHFMTTAQQDLDTLKTDGVNIALRAYGAHPVVRVPYWLLKTQEESDDFFRDLYQEIA